MINEEMFTDTLNILLRAAQAAGKRLVTVNVEKPMLRKERYRVRSLSGSMIIAADDNLSIAEMAERMGREL